MHRTVLFTIGAALVASACISEPSPANGDAKTTVATPPKPPQPLVCAVESTSATGGRKIKFELGKGANMCWAAVANYVSQLAGEPLSQCEIASAMQETPTSDGCYTDTGRVTPECDKPGLPNHAMERLLGVTSTWIDRQLPESEMRSEITAISPVILQVKDPNGVKVSHFVFISYYEQVNGLVYYEVLDPALGTVFLTYDQLAAGYHIQGEWVWSWTLHHISRDGAACGL